MILQCSGKTKWLKVVAISFYIMMFMCALRALASTGTIVLAQGITRPDSAEQAAEPDTFDGDTWLILRPVDYFWVACTIGANVLFFARMIILFAYGIDSDAVVNWLQSMSSGIRFSLLQISHSIVPG